MILFKKKKRQKDNINTKRAYNLFRNRVIRGLKKAKVDIMIEAKQKEQAIFKLYKKYKFLDCKIKLKINKKKIKMILIFK